MFSLDKRIIYIILVIALLSNIGSIFSDPLGLLIGIPGLLIAITFHEYAHAITAYKLGDDTAKMQGRVSLNPLKHIDPIGILMLAILKFGWGKPVQVNTRNFNRNISMSKAEAIVSIAGPIANFILAIIFALVYVIIKKFCWLDGFYAANIINAILQNIILMNIGLGVFNLIPLPPLDGSKVLSHFLPYKAKMWFEENEQIFYIVFLVIWISGIAAIIISPTIYLIKNGLINLLSLIFRI